MTKPETLRQCKLVYVLGHQYTNARLSFQYLKKKDALVAKCLARFCNESNGAFELYLCKIRYEFKWRGDEMTRYDASRELGDEEMLEKRLNLLSPWVACVAGKKYFKVRAKSWWKKVKGKLESEIVPVGVFERKSFKFDGEKEELNTGNESASLKKWYMSAALLVMPASVAVRAQSRGSPDDTFSRWVSLAETDPRQARAVARGFGCAFIRKWSLASEIGEQLLETARRLGSLDLVQSVLTSVARLKFQPKLRETVATFSAEEVAAMAKAVSESWGKCDLYSVRDYLSSSRMNLVASLLDGVRDPVAIKAMRSAVPMDADDCEYWKMDEYARVLLLASRASLDQAKQLLWVANVKFLLKTAVPATQLMTESCGLDDWDAVKPVACYVIDWLTTNEPLVRNSAYEDVSVKCHRCPNCDCKDVKQFLSSDSESQTQTAPQAKRLLEALKLKRLIKMAPTTGKPGATLATKTDTSKAVAKMHTQLQALQEAVAKQT